MKKSIVAMLSITALATVANADNADTLDQMTGTNFEGKQNGGGFFATTETEGGNFYWYASTNSAERGAQLGTYTNSQEYGSYNGPRPAIAAQANTTNSCLLVDTEGERLFRAIGPRASYDEQGDDSSFTQFSIANTVYFDSLVQFTVNEDEAPTIQTGDKLAVWLQGGETTNLVVTAGYFNSDDALVATNYVVSINNEAVTLEPGTWHRLTIEAINIFDTTEDAFVGFRIYVDGTLLNTGSAISVGQFDELPIFDDFNPTDKAKNYVQEGVLFPALYSAGDNHGSISCVAFEGTGAVDDLTFTPNDPFAGVEPPPAEPGYVEGGVTNTYSDATAFVAAFKSGKVLALPEGWVFNAQTGDIGPENGTAFATVHAYYNVAADGTISLNETVVKPVLGTTEGTGDDPDTEPITVGATTVTLNVTNGKAGLYYGVRKYTALGGESSDTWNQTAQTADGNVTLTVDKTANATAEFYQVIVTDIAPATPTPEPTGN